MANAEGSRDLTSNGGYRPYLNYYNANYFGVFDRTRIFVYAQSGETLYLGSSANGLNNGRINVIPPSGGAGTLCSTTVGIINTRAQEVQGPSFTSGDGGYTPCIFPVNATGIWEIQFRSPNNTSTSYAQPSARLGANEWATPTTTDRFVAAWDVTVRNSSGTVQTGRAFTKYLAAIFGLFSDGAFQAPLYFITVDGYQYRVNPNGLNPFQFSFFSNNKGVYNTGTGDPTYRSYDLSLPAGVTFHDPNTNDTATNITNKMFFNQPSSALPTSATVGGSTTWLLPTLSQPPQPGDLSLTGNEGSNSQIGQGIGGTFSFNNPDSVDRPFQIILDLNDNNIYGDGNDRALVGTASPGANTVNWDGRDGNGDIVQAQSTSYEAAVALLGGEVHFPIVDAESNRDGFIFQRLNGTFSGPVNSFSYNADRIYYDDSQMAGNGGSGGGAAIPPNPAQAIIGVDSATGGHTWGTSGSSGFGNATVIDTWAYAPEFSGTILSITVKAADLQIAKALSGGAFAGQTVTYTIDVSNVRNESVGSIDDAENVTVEDILPSVFSNPEIVSCTVTSGTADCGTSGFTGNTFNATVDLNSDSSIRFVLRATLSSSASGTVSNTATVTRPDDIGDPVDQDSSGGTNDSESVTISSTIQQPLDYGDAPDIYGTDATDNAGEGIGPSHRIVSGLQLGTAPDQEADASTPLDGTGDGADEDGIVLPALVAGNTTYTIPQDRITATNSTGTNATLHAWIDFNSDNNFSDSEYQSITVDGSGATGSLVWTNLPTLTIGATTYARFRLTTDASVTQFTPAGNSASNGEVEDYALTIYGTPNVLLVKRITAINQATTNPNDGTVLSLFIDDTSSSQQDNDNHPGWPNNYLMGAIDGGRVKLGDTIEYTVYFLSAGDTSVDGVTVCDRLQPDQSFQLRTYNSGNADLQLQLGTDPVLNLTAANDEGPTGDRAQFIPAGAAVPNTCNLKGLNNNGTLVIDITGASGTGDPGLTTFPNSTGQATPNNSYGLFRFVTQVDE